MINTRVLAGRSHCLGVSCAAGAAFFIAGAAFATLPPVPVPPQNPITEPKRVLGKILFWDEQFSTSNVVSCGTCHVPNRGGADNRLARNPGLDATLNTPDDILGSAGVIHSDAGNNYERDPVFALNPQITGRAANSIFASAYAVDLFWDGRARSQFVDPQTGQVAIPVGGGLESQTVGPPVNSVEMAHEGADWNMLTEKLTRVQPLNLATNHPADVASALADHPSYPELFRRAFGDEQITARRIAFAIATYERTLIANQTPFDAFRAGVPNAMTPQQVQGFNAFSGPGSNCAACHNVTQDLFTDQSFRNIGFRPPAEDLGRQIVTGNPNDRGKFKVPSLRNVGLKQSFMHNGQFQSLTQVIQFYARAPGAAPQFPDNRDPIMPNVNVPPQVAPLIQDFLQNALTDPRAANQTFPFDKPTLFVDRPADRATLLGGGVAGSGGIVPRIIVQAPPMIGNSEYRVGVDGALGGAAAALGISFNAPVNGRITPQWFAGSVTAAGGGAGQGLGTLHWPLSIAQFSPGQVIFAQWFVADPAAPGGQALSNVARIPLFCGSAGCPPCDADVNCDGAVNGFDVQAMEQAVNGDLTDYCQADPDFNHDGTTNGFDVEAVELVVNGEPCP
ncbi:Cytochrome c551 peroxidase [Phycisphaerales bacterium]|nr:Cytochrome c551 peroxidase [Phycisphaerales bacterium]